MIKRLKQSYFFIISKLSDIDRARPLIHPSNQPSIQPFKRSAINVYRASNKPRNIEKILKITPFIKNRQFPHLPLSLSLSICMSNKLYEIVKQKNQFRKRKLPRE